MKGGVIMCDEIKTVSSLEECKKLEEEGYEVASITYWEGFPETTEYNMIKRKDGKKISVPTF